MTTIDDSNTHFAVQNNFSNSYFRRVWWNIILSNCGM